MTFIKKVVRILIAHWRLSAVVFGVLAAIGLLLYAGSLTSRFDSEFEAYTELAAEQEQAAYLPGAPNNPVRQDLNRVLASVLVEGLSAKDRFSLAQNGLDSLAELEKQIDALGELSDKVNAAIARMQVDSVGNISSSAETHELLTLAKKRASIIADIRGLSYRADYETKKIFDRIIADDGALTKEHVVDLNEEIPAVEEQFNRRAALYDELQSVSVEIREKSKNRGGFSLTFKK